jgi:hypothetical protein
MQVGRHSRIGIIAIMFAAGCKPGSTKTTNVGSQKATASSVAAAENTATCRTQSQDSIFSGCYRANISVERLCTSAGTELSPPRYRLAGAGAYGRDEAVTMCNGAVSGNGTRIPGRDPNLTPSPTPNGVLNSVIGAVVSTVVQGILFPRPSAPNSFNSSATICPQQLQTNLFPCRVQLLRLCDNFGRPYNPEQYSVGGAASYSEFEARTACQ